MRKGRAMGFMKTLRRIWLLLSIPIFIAIWWLSEYGTAEQQAAFTYVIYLYLFGAVLQTLANGVICLRRFFQSRRGGSGEG